NNLTSPARRRELLEPRIDPIVTEAVMTDRPLAMDPVLTPALAGQYAQMVMGGLVREYPNQPGFRLTGDEDLRPPRQVHPAFYGCYDWHSAVHGHWLLIRLLRTGLLSPSTATEAGQLL